MSSSRTVPRAAADPAPDAAAAALAAALAERDAARAALAGSAARVRFLEAVLESLDVGVVAADADGRVALLNGTARRWHAFAGTDDAAEPAPEGRAPLAARWHLYEADGTTRLTARRSPLHRALHEGEVSAAEVVIAPPERPATVAACSGRALRDEDGTCLGAAVVLVDVTVDRAREAALRAAHDRLGERGDRLQAAVRELERSNADLEDFAAVAGHDLGSPLQVVAGSLELLGDVSGDALDERAAEWLDAAVRGTDRLQDLVAALLSYARAGTAPHCRELTEVREVLDEAVLDLRGRLRATGARVVGDGLPRVHCDPVLLQQLLRHLVSSALDRRDPQRPCRVRVAAELSEDDWTFSVTDNGATVPAAQRAGLFERSAAPGPDGSAGGIGLATCRRVVERHGGRIWAEEGPSGGTAVRFTLPQRGARRPGAQVAGAEG